MVSILNPAAIDALCSAAYLEHYLDCVDDLPVDLQRHVSMLRELDCLANGKLFCRVYGLLVKISYNKSSCRLFVMKLVSGY